MGASLVKVRYTSISTLGLVRTGCGCNWTKGETSGSKYPSSDVFLKRGAMASGSYKPTYAEVPGMRTAVKYKGSSIYRELDGRGFWLLAEPGPGANLWQEW